MSDLTKNKTESALISSARYGDAEAFETLAKKYELLLDWFISRLDIPHSERDDLYQEGLLGLLRAVRTYDSSYSAFGTYASVCIKNSIISAVRRYRKQSDNILYDDLLVDSAVSEGFSPESELIDRESVSLLYNSFYSVLSEYEISIFNLYMNGLPARDISILLGKEPRSVTNAIYRIKKKLSVTIQKR